MIVEIDEVHELVYDYVSSDGYRDARWCLEVFDSVEDVADVLEEMSEVGYQVFTSEEYVIDRDIQIGALELILENYSEFVNLIRIKEEYNPDPFDEVPFEEPIFIWTKDSETETWQQEILPR